MSLSYCGSKENKENQYHHDVHISPEKKRTSGNICRPCHPNNNPSKHMKEDDIVSPTLLKTRKQLVELWLNPVVTLDTSLEHTVEDDGPGYECNCLKEHLN